MFQKTKQLCRKAFGFVNGIPTKVMMFSFMLLSGMVAKAQNSAGDYSAGTSALSTVAEEIAKYVPIMVKLCYAIAGVVAIVGAISVYIAMNNEEQDVKKKIMMVVGACIFLHCGGQGVASVLRYCRLNIKDKYERQGRTLSGLPAVQGTATAS